MSAAPDVVGAPMAPPALTYLDLLPPGSPQSPDTSLGPSPPPPATSTRFNIPLDEKEHDGIRIHVYLLFYEDHALLWSMLEQAFVEMEERRLNRALAWLEEIEAVEIEPVPAPNPWSAEDALVSLVPHPSPPPSNAGSADDNATAAVDPKLPLPWPGSHVHSPMHPATPGGVSGLALLPVLLSEQEYQAETSAVPSEMASHVSKTPRRRRDLHHPPQTPGAGRGSVSRESRSRPSRSTLDMTALARTEAPPPSPPRRGGSKGPFLVLNDAESTVSAAAATRPPITSSKSVTILEAASSARPSSSSSASRTSYPPEPPPTLTHSQSTPSFNPSSSRFENMRFIPLLGGGGITTHAAEALNSLSNNYSFLADFRRAQVTPPSSDWWVSETTTPYLGPTDGAEEEDRGGLELDLGSSSLRSAPAPAAAEMDEFQLDADVDETSIKENGIANGQAPAATSPARNFVRDDEEETLDLDESLLHASAKQVAGSGSGAATDWRHRISSQQGGANLDDRPVGVLLHSMAKQQQQGLVANGANATRSRRASAQRLPAMVTDPNAKSSSSRG